MAPSQEKIKKINIQFSHDDDELKVFFFLPGQLVYWQPGPTKSCGLEHFQGFEQRSVAEDTEAEEKTIRFGWL